MATVKVAYAADVALTISPASLASSSTFVAGTESASIDNSTNLYDDALLSGTIMVGTTPTSGTFINIYVFSPYEDTPTYPDVMDGTSSAETVTSAGVGIGFLKLAASMYVDSTTSNRAYYFGQVSVAQLFGGVLPKTWSVFLAHNTGVALNATGGNHAIYYQGITYTVA